MGVKKVLCFIKKIGASTSVFTDTKSERLTNSMKK